MGLPLIPCSLFILITLLLPTVFAQMNDQDNQANPSSLSSSSSDDGLRFTYTKLGISTPNYQRISYDSERNFITLTNISTAINKNTDSDTISSAQAQSQSQSHKQLSNSDENDLQQMIEQNGFFEANSIYLPTNPVTDTGKQDYDTLHVLNVEMDNRHHTVLWMDTSEKIPTGITAIAKVIQKLASM